LYCSNGSCGSGLCFAVWPEGMARLDNETRPTTNPVIESFAITMINPRCESSRIQGRELGCQGKRTDRQKICGTPRSCCCPTNKIRLEDQELVPGYLTNATRLWERALAPPKGLRQHERRRLGLHARWPRSVSELCQVFAVGLSPVSQCQDMTHTRNDLHRVSAQTVL